MVLILIAGIDTTWSAIGSAIWHLARHPDDLARLVNEPELMPVAVEEFLRFYAPVTMARLVAEDHEFFGCPMKKDDWVLLGFPAANRDPNAFEDADKFIIDRAANRHAAFGLGIHRCVGSNLARLELRVAIEEFIKRFPRFELADRDAVTWAPGQVRGPRQLPAANPELGALQTEVRAGLTPQLGHPRLDLVGVCAAAPPRGSVDPVAVTRTSSSMRTPMPRYSSGTVRSFAWK